jgi:hypothetical protein
MKKFILSLGLLTLAAHGFAKSVNTQTALQVAKNFIGSYSNSRTVADLGLSTTYYSKTNPQQAVIYVFSAPHAFVLVAADDKSKPILGYSTESAFGTENISPEVSYWLDNYKTQIDYAVAHSRTPIRAITNQWNDLAQDLGGSTAGKPTGVSPMIATTWDQMPVYNLLCPTGTPTGCVATAMAQIMKFWNNPTTGTGSHSYSSSTQGGTMSANFGATTYSWANMPNVVNSSSTTTQKNAVATLMFHCGVSVDMDYAPSGSGAQVIDMSMGWPCSENAMKNYFGYKSTIKGYDRADFSDTQWVKMLKFEINTGRPVLYAGFGQVGGHAFDFDGYDDNGLFHINWGWGGMSNGYFEVDDLSPSALGTGGGAGNFNYGHQALVMIEPAGSTLPANPFTPDYPNNNTTADLALNSEVVASADTIIFNTAYAVTTDIINNGTETFQDGVLAILALDINGDNGFLLDGQVQTLAPSGVYHYAFSTTGTTDLIPGTYYIGFFYGLDVNNLELNPISDGLGTNETMLTVIAKPTGINEPSQNDMVKTYPNPAKDKFTLDWKGYSGKVLNVSLVSLTGQQVYNQDAAGTQCIIPVSQYTSGIYMLNIRTDKGTLSKKMVIRK